MKYPNPLMKHPQLLLPDVIFALTGKSDSQKARTK